MKMYQIIVVVLCVCIERTIEMPVEEYLKTYSHLPSLYEHNYGKFSAPRGKTLVEGDIIKIEGHTRQAVTNDAKTWRTNTINYTLEPNDYNSTEKSFIQSTLERMASLTGGCIKFNHLTSRTTAQEFIRIKKEDGCYSAVGKQGGSQTLSLAKYCYINGSEWYRGTIMHEVMHALGFWHEHTRPDRDNYITVNTSNIMQKYERDYDIMAANDVKILVPEYDFYSVMHYSPYTFARSPEVETFKPKNKSVDMSRIGQRSDLTEKDVMKIKKLYKCDRGEGIHCEMSSRAKSICVKSEYETGSSLYCSCKDNKHILVGPSIKICTNTGRWTGDDPVCLPEQNWTDFCDFSRTNRNRFCGWNPQTENNYAHWIPGAGSTLTAKTGPAFDHTLVTSAGYYMYIESSSPAYEGQKFRMRKSNVRIPTGRKGKEFCMSFYYNAYGKGIKPDGLRVFVTQSGNFNTEQKVWPTRNSKFIVGGEDWKRAETLQQPIPLRLEGYQYHIDVIIEAERGSSFESDIAVDDILIASCDDLKFVYLDRVRN